LLELLDGVNPKAVSRSLLKTSAGFTNPSIPSIPSIPPAAMLRSMERRDPFYNPELAQQLAADWGVPTVNAKGKHRKTGEGESQRKPWP
jgi:predicted alpha/beta hydrolase family esterase